MTEYTKNQSTQKMYSLWIKLGSIKTKGSERWKKLQGIIEMKQWKIGRSEKYNLKLIKYFTQRDRNIYHVTNEKEKKWHANKEGKNFS